MLKYENLAGRVLQRGHERFPVQRAMTDIRPTILVGILTGVCYVLDVSSYDPVAQLLDPRKRVLTTTCNPRNIQLHAQFRTAFQDQVHRMRAGIRELEVMVVPAESQTGIAKRLSRLLKPCAEVPPARVCCRLPDPG